jgi:hypothetical protein
MNALMLNNGIAAELQVRLSSQPYPVYIPAPRPLPAQG